MGNIEIYTFIFIIAISLVPVCFFACVLAAQIVVALLNLGVSCYAINLQTDWTGSALMYFTVFGYPLVDKDNHQIYYYFTKSGTSLIWIIKSDLPWKWGTKKGRNTCLNMELTSGKKTSICFQNISWTNYLLLQTSFTAWVDRTPQKVNPHSDFLFLFLCRAATLNCTIIIALAAVFSISLIFWPHCIPHLLLVS